MKIREIFQSEKPGVNWLNDNDGSRNLGAKYKVLKH